ncbi:subtilisin-like protease SBT1.8 [Brachypodium distachyon]|uniref:Uncharacterized protein n=1 Tax=Brachypodium distachyon TaxID=15368 RepID=I1J0H7_BRADI|nr:subtilisin-like protease SBT1.8 [Brachypodium distachyon]PNT61635.1 hypothetical protein BRADI_5g18100v3 [Brachypodium distachyon]|eukprot:XP_003581517.1 subtilisin-like protease SBT1.8 [Brachypodium distachyon]
MDNPNHGGCSPTRLVLTVLLLCVAATPAASHGGPDTGVHSNFLVIVRRPYEYDTNVYKNVSSWHASLLASVCDMAKEALDKDPASVTRLIYSYRNVVNGFSARLTPEELQEMSQKDWFLKAYPERTYHLMTTHTPKMLGLMGGGSAKGSKAEGVWNTSNMGEGIIIGILDDGIYAGHPSFDGAGMKPPPEKWNGRCDFNNTVCNNKLIGARSFFESAKWKWKGLEDPVLPINEGQHGTHTSSTAAGAFVPSANITGNAVGTSSGMAPRAHIAFYQVCFELKGCDRDDILAAVDEAIEDGVDILSMSLGGNPGADFSEDPVSLGGFTAVLNNVFVSTAAGNVGPNPATLANGAPWLLTVGASTTDRRFVGTVKLGSGVELDGESMSEPKDYGSEMRPLVRDVNNGKCTNENVLRAQNITGKIIICEPGGGASTKKAKMVRRAGAFGMIAVVSQVFGAVVVPRPHVLPTVQVPYVEGQKIKAYAHSTDSPTANLIFKGTTYDNPRSPMMAPFSSRGPNTKSRGILKPDIIGPGVNILAGVPGVVDLVLPPNTAMPKFDIKSGTSMACPHLGGIAALMKNAHPTWSPASIKSALMTTTETTDNTGKPIADVDGSQATYYATGAGHVNPEKAMDPGLVYNMTAQDYIPYLCGLNYTDQQVNSIIHPEPVVECAKLPKLDQKDLNYPSITVIINNAQSVVNVTRAVTNVGEAVSTYVVEVDVPKSVTVEVMPTKLMFKEVEEVLNYTVTVKADTVPESTIEGQLKWVFDKHIVRSPILILPGTGEEEVEEEEEAAANAAAPST